jgi:hypothetical protein
VAETRPVSVPVRPVIAASRPVTPSVSTAMTGAAISGSALGMARNASLALPRPVPVTASQWVSNGNGGG